MSTTLVIGSVDCNDGVTTELLAMDIGKPSRVAAEYGGPGVDIAASGPVDESAWVEAWFRIRVMGASLDATTAVVAAIAAEVRDLATIIAGLDGSAYTGQLVPKIGECVKVPLEHPAEAELIHAHRTVIEVIVRREPWVYGASDALYTAFGIDAPALLSHAAQSGQASAPLNLLLDAGALTLAGCYVGHTSDEAAVIADFVKPLVAATWLKTGGGAATGAAAADAAGYPAGAGNTVWATLDATGDTTAVDVTDFLGGSYLVLGNLKYVTGATGVYAKQQFGDWTPVTTAALKLLPLGIVSLPTRAVRGAGTSTLDISIKGNATNSAAVNYVALLPVSDGLIGYVLASGHVHVLRWEDGTLYVTGLVGGVEIVESAELANSLSGAVPLLTLGGQLVVLAENATAAPTTHLHATVAATPRYEQLPSP